MMYGMRIKDEEGNWLEVILGSQIPSKGTVDKVSDLETAVLEHEEALSGIEAYEG